MLKQLIPTTNQGYSGGILQQQTDTLWAGKAALAFSCEIWRNEGAVAGCGWLPCSATIAEPDEPVVLVLEPETAACPECWLWADKIPKIVWIEESRAPNFSIASCLLIVSGALGGSLGGAVFPPSAMMFDTEDLCEMSCYWNKNSLKIWQNPSK